MSTVESIMSKTGAIALYTTTKALDAAIIAMHTAGQSFQQEVHKVACSVLHHVGKTGDVRVIEVLMTKLFQALPEMSRANSLRDWFMEFGPITFDGNKAVHTKTGKTEGKIKLGDAMDKPFWKFSPEKPYMPVDVAASLASLIKKLQKDEKETKQDHGLVINALEAQLVAVQAKAKADPRLLAN